MNLKHAKNLIDKINSKGYILNMKNSDKREFSKMSTEKLDERKGQIISSLSSIEHVIHGSLIQSFVKCGKSNCRCANGEGHKALRLSSFYHGRTAIDHVPASWEAWIRTGIDNYRSVQELLLELAEIYLALFKRRGKKEDLKCQNQR